jgi:cytochrome c
MKMLTLIAILAGSISLSACGKSPSDETSATTASPGAPVEMASADTAPASFAQCSVCHKVIAGAPNGVGPNLHGVFGKKAGGVVGFSYSAGMKESGLIWDEANLDKYLENPRKLVAGTKMSFAGQADAAKRKEIIAWLKKNS